MTSMSKKEFLEHAIELKLFAKCKNSSQAPWKSVIEKVRLLKMETSKNVTEKCSKCPGLVAKDSPKNRQQKHVETGNQ